MTPTTWGRIRIADLVSSGEAEVRTGPFGTQLHASDYITSGTPVINVRNIGFGGIRADKLEYISDETVRRLSGHVLEPGDIVFGRKGAVERHVLIREGQNKWFQGSDCLRLRLRTKRVVPEFLSYYLLTRDHQTWMMQQCSHGATMASLNQDIVGRIEFSAPDPAGQEAIAAILSAYDDLIENNTRRVAILEEMARRIYEEWFVRFRFPGHEDVRMVESELGLVPEGWEVVRMDSICERITDGSHYSPKSVESGKPMASVKDMHDWGIDLSTCRRISDYEYEMLVRNDCKPRLNDVLIAKDGSYLKHTFVVDQEIDLVVLSSIAILRPNERMAANQLAMYLRLPDVASRMKGYVSGVAIPRIVLRDFRQFRVLLSPREVQAAWATVCDPMLSLCRTLVRKNAILRATRDLLLPKLISGEVDVSEIPDLEAVAA